MGGVWATKGELKNHLIVLDFFYLKFSQPAYIFLSTSMVFRPSQGILGMKHLVAWFFAERLWELKYIELVACLSHFFVSMSRPI